MTAYETYRGAGVGCLTVIDNFAKVRGTRGFMPGPIPPLRFTLVAREVQANVMVALDPPITLYAQSGTEGVYLFPDQARIGHSEWMRVDPGKYRLRVESDFYQTLEQELPWPPLPPPPPNQPTQLDLQPGFAYPFPDVTVPAARLTLLRGSVVADVDGAPVAGATIELIDPPNMGPFATATSDARGAWVLAVPLPAAPAEQTVHVRITLPDNTAIDVVDLKVKPAADNSMPQTALRGQVLTTGGSAVTGAEISVGFVPNKSVRSGRDGAWAFFFGLTQPGVAAVQVTAKTPDGQTDSKTVDVETRRTIVVPPFRFAMN